MSPPTSPVFTVPFGSNRIAWTSSVAFGQCSTPRGTTNTSFGFRMTSRSRTAYVELGGVAQFVSIRGRDTQFVVSLVNLALSHAVGA